MRRERIAKQEEKKVYICLMEMERHFEVSQIVRWIYFLTGKLALIVDDVDWNFVFLR